MFFIHQPKKQWTPHKRRPFRTVCSFTETDWYSNVAFVFLRVRVSQHVYFIFVVVLRSSFSFWSCWKTRNLIWRFIFFVFVQYVSTRDMGKPASGKQSGYCSRYPRLVASYNLYVHTYIWNCIKKKIVYNLTECMANDECLLKFCDEIFNFLLFFFICTVSKCIFFS